MSDEKFKQWKSVSTTDLAGRAITEEDILNAKDKILEASKRYHETLGEYILRAEHWRTLGIDVGTVPDWTMVVVTGMEWIKQWKERPNEVTIFGFV